MRTVPAFVPEALAASQVGTWRTDLMAESYIVDETTAAFFGLDPGKAALGLPLSQFVHVIHPADRGVFNAKHRRVAEQGGLFVVEYRTVPRPNEVHWVLTRGRYEHDPETDTMQGRGICIDITESKLDGHVEDRALFMVLDGPGTPLDRAAGHAIEARKAVDEIEGKEANRLRHAVDALLYLIGRALALRADRSMSRFE